MDCSLLPLLRCVGCGSSQIRPLNDTLVCDACTTVYEVRPPGIPRLMTEETTRRNTVHEQEWDSMPHADYDQICRDNRAVWNAIDSLVMKYCHGFALEVCCGTGRFLDVLRRDRRVNKVFGIDVSIGMLRGAWDKGHRCLLQSSAEWNRRPRAVEREEKAERQSLCRSSQSRGHSQGDRRVGS